MEKMRIGIFYSKQTTGSFSLKRLKKEALALGLKPEVIEGSKVNVLVASPRRFRVYVQNERYELPPVIISRLHATSSETNLLIQTHIQRTKMSRVINTSRSISIARDKFKTMQTLAAKGYKIPKTVLVGSSKKIEWAIHAVGGLPVILKLSQGLKGIGVVMINSLSTARSVHDLAAKNNVIIVQENIAVEPGVDYRFYVVGNKVVAAMKRISRAKDEFRANIARGGYGVSYHPSEQVAKLAVSVAKAVGLEVCGVDMIKTSKGFVPIEINVNASLKRIEKVTKINVAREIIKYAKECGEEFILKKNNLSK